MLAVVSRGSSSADAGWRVDIQGYIDHNGVPSAVCLHEDEFFVIPIADLLVWRP